MRLRIRHTTKYSFDQPVTSGLQQLRKTPKSSHDQTVLSWRTGIVGGKKELSFDDHHNNVVELLSIEKGATSLAVTSEGEVEIAELHGVVGPHIGPAPLWLYRKPTQRTRAGQNVVRLLQSVPAGEPLERLHGLLRAVHEAVAYEIGASEPEWTAEDALVAGRGVCQDHAHVFVAAARHMGLPARYVSGYLMLNDRIEQDAMHAWAEAHIDGLGWVGFDPSNGISPDTRYVRVATGPDYSDAAPVIGTRTGGTGERLAVEIEVAQQ